VRHYSGCAFVENKHGLRMNDPATPTRQIMRITIAALYGAAAVAHLLAPDQLLLITPSWVPFPRAIILLTGWFELAAAAALLTPPLRRQAGIGMALYALVVWPANFKHAFYGIQLPYVPDGWIYHGPRLLLQPVIMWWALYCADVIDWPFRTAGPHSPRDG
jgi:uncharacterized membrane protein